MSYLPGHWYFLLHCWVCFWKISVELFSSIFVFFNSRVYVYLKNCFYFCVELLILFMHCFPNFNLLSICVFLYFTKLSQNYYFKFFVWQFIHLHFFKVSYWNLISFLWWYHIYLIFHYPWFLSLVSVHLSNQAPLPDFIGLLWQRQFFTSWLGLGFLVCRLAGNVLGQLGPGIIFYSGARQLF